jgi:hypothetical protein
MKRVIVESPYAGDILANTTYARRCLSNCLKRGEAPIASHLLYTQPGVLNDHIAEERELGIAAGLAWWVSAELIVFYVDRGWSPGMEAAFQAVAEQKLPFEIRKLGVEAV